MDRSAGLRVIHSPAAHLTFAMKPRSIIYLQNGQSFKLSEPLPEIFNIYLAATRRGGGEGTALELHRVTDHGPVKTILVPLGMINMMGEA
jgi:hypothetical protein